MSSSPSSLRDVGSTIARDARPWSRWLRDHADAAAVLALLAILPIVDWYGEELWPTPVPWYALWTLALLAALRAAVHRNRFAELARAAGAAPVPLLIALAVVASALVISAPSLRASLAASEVVEGNLAVSVFGVLALAVTLAAVAAWTRTGLLPPRRRARVPAFVETHRAAQRRRLARRVQPVYRAWFRGLRDRRHACVVLHGDDVGAAEVLRLAVSRQHSALARWAARSDHGKRAGRWMREIVLARATAALTEVDRRALRRAATPRVLVLGGARRALPDRLACAATRVSDRKSLRALLDPRDRVLVLRSAEGFDVRRAHALRKLRKKVRRAGARCLVVVVDEAHVAGPLAADARPWLREKAADVVVTEHGPCLARRRHTLRGVIAKRAR